MNKQSLFIIAALLVSAPLSYAAPLSKAAAPATDKEGATRSPANTEATISAMPAGSLANGAATKKKKSTEVSFDEALVQGRYHFTDESVTTVEDDKVLDALLGVRTDFKDRMKKSTTRY